MGAALALASCAALTATAGAAAASPAKSQPAPVRILSPAEGAVVTSKRLVIRVRAHGSHLRVVVDGRDVSRRFGPGHGGVRTATLKRGRDFRLGANSLRVEVGRGSSRRRVSRHFEALVPADGRVRVKRLAPGADHAPIELRMRTSGKIARVRMWVNGRAVRSAIPRFADRRGFFARLGAFDGVRYGRNKVVAEVRYRDHRISRTRRVFDVSRRRPLTGAGPDRRTVPGRGVRLDGGWTRPTRPGAHLLYRWTVLGKPAGSKVGVAHSKSRRGFFRADVPGTYRLRLKVAEVGPGAVARGSSAAAEASASAAGAGEGNGEASGEAGGEPKGASTCPAPPGEATTPALPLVPLGEPMPANPLSPPACVTPTVEEHPPALPAAAATTADEVLVEVAPTKNPLGETLQTLAADGSIRLENHAPFPREGSFAHLLVLNEKTLLPEEGAWGKGNQGIGVGEAGSLAEKVERTGSRNIVIINGNGNGQSGQTAALQSAIAKAVTVLGGSLPSGAEGRASLLAQAAGSGEWSIVGAKGESGRTYQNLSGLAETSPPGVSEASLPGGLNGYLQIVTGSTYSFVSSEIVPIDTRAPGSTENQNVLEVGTQTFTSGYVPNGVLAVHLLVLPTDGEGGLTASGGQVTPLDQETYVIDKPYNQTNQGSWNSSEGRGEGVMGLAYSLERWRRYGPDDLIVLQTFGENGVANYTAPGASPNWVNDALIPHSDKGLFQWYGQPYVSPGSEGLAAALVKMWNPGYPTVAGQVGALTGSVGHDLVANFGGAANSDNNGGYAVTRLSMIATNHPADPELNYVKGSGPDTGGPTAAATGQLVGTLTRTHQAQWTVQAASPNPALGSSSLWQLAFKAPTAWPDSGTPAFTAAMTYIAKQLWPDEEITNVRAAYISKESAIESVFARDLERVPFKEGLGFKEPEFLALREQLETEVLDIIRVKKIFAEWKEILSVASFSGYVDVEGIGREIEANAIANANDRNSTTSIDPNAILSESLYIGADLLGPETGGISEGVAVAAGVFGLVDAISPNDSDDVAPGPDPSVIRDRAGQLATDVVNRFDLTANSLEHLNAIFMADWGKLSAAAEAARGPWAFGTEVRDAVKQALAVSTATAFYEAMLPVSYQMWVIAPYVTDTNGTGPNRPANDYQCIHYRTAIEGNQIQKPFSGEPSGAMSWVNYRPWEAPGSTTFPAQPYTQNYTVRALKSWNDPLTLHFQDGINENEGSAGVTVEEWGANPPQQMVNQLFQPISPNEADVQLPKSLGIDKVEFYGRYSGGGGWSRVICAEYQG
jgi:hypothetical protein